MYGPKPPAARPLAHPTADGGLVARMKSADAGPATFGSRGLSQLRDLIPKMQAMGYPQAPTASDPRAAQLQAMIPQMEAMGYKQQPQQYFADGGFVQGIKRAFGMDEERNAQIAAYRARAAAEKAQAAQQQAQQPQQPQQRAISDYSGMSATQRREKELGLADGGLVRGLADAVRPFSESVGGYWSNSNKEFEATNPGVGGRIVRAVNPVTGLGSAIGAMYDAAGNGIARDAAIAAAQAYPMFAAMKVVPAAKSILPAAPKVAAAVGETASKVTSSTGAGVVADEAQARGFANGGRVRPRGFVAGKGTETSDSIPARLSNGEYVLPADTVRAVGVEALDALRESTHKPVKGEQINAARGFFAGGTPGGVGTWFQDQEREQQQRKQAALAAGQDAESATQAAAASPTQDNTSATQAGAYAPGTRGAQLVAAEQQKAQDRMATGNALVNAIKAPFSKPAAPATPSLTAPAISPEAPAQNPTDMRLAAGTQTSPMSGAMNQPKPQPDAPGDTATTTAREVVPGVFNHGRGQYSDDPNGMNMPKGFTGQPSAANNAILQRMSDQSQAQSMARVGMSQYDAEVQRAKNINADEAARNNSVAARMQRLADPFTAEGRAMRNLQMDIASSMDRNGRPTGETQALVAKSNAMSGGYLAEPGQQSAIAAGLQREGMQQAGANARAMLSSGIDQQRVNLASNEFGLKRETQGIANRSANMIQAMQQQIAAEQDPAKRQGLVQRMLDVEGKHQTADPYLVVPGGQNVDPQSGKAYNTPSSVFNRQTGQWIQQPQGQGVASQQFQTGQIYVDGQGRRAKFNGSGWEPA